jgi:uncharacterized hydantoinase/oxoprolinase family protein
MFLSSAISVVERSEDLHAVSLSCGKGEYIVERAAEFLENEENSIAQ